MFNMYVKDLSDATASKHNFYRVTPEEIAMSEAEIPLPVELKAFYHEIGYGFFHRGYGSINRLLSPLQFKQINNKEDFYANDPELELYFERYNGLKYLFMEINEGLYLAIDKVDENGKNAIYLFDDKIANSLLEFLVMYDKHPGFFES